MKRKRIDFRFVGVLPAPPDQWVVEQDARDPTLMPDVVAYPVAGWAVLGRRRDGGDAVEEDINIDCEMSGFGAGTPLFYATMEHGRVELQAAEPGTEDGLSWRVIFASSREEAVSKWKAIA